MYTQRKTLIRHANIQVILRMSTDYSKKLTHQCNASAGCTFMAREAGYQIPAITINAINIQTIETHMTNLPQVASVASVKVTSAITMLIHIIKAGIEASANSSNPSPSNCQRILHAAAHGHAQGNLAATMAGTEPESSHQPMNTLKTKNTTMSLALRMYGVIPSAAFPFLFSVLCSSVCRKDRME